jgi:hypothetical protein
MPEPSALQLVSDLGAGLGSLIACFWFIKYQADNFSKREELWIRKDGENDEALRQLMQSSHTQLIQILTSVNSTLQEMTVAIAELKQTIHNGK